MNFLKYIVLINLVSFPVFASDLNLKCIVLYNSEEILSTPVTLHSKERNLKFGEYQQFRFFLSENSTEKENSTELQIYDGTAPSRSYAVADLTKSKKIELSIWTRDYLLMVECEK